jgi:hypothetical protein
MFANLQRERLTVAHVILSEAKNLMPPRRLSKKSSSCANAQGDKKEITLKSY